MSNPALSYYAHQPDFEERFGRPPTPLEIATRALWDAEGDLTKARRDMVKAREKLAVAELRLERKQKLVDAKRIERDEASLDELAASAPPLTEIDRRLATLSQG